MLEAQKEFTGLGGVAHKGSYTQRPHPRVEDFSENMKQA